MRFASPNQYQVRHILTAPQTTAHTLCFTFGLLALYPDYQEKLYQHIKSIIPDGRIPTYDEMDKFTESLAYVLHHVRSRVL